MLVTLPFVVVSFHADNASRLRRAGSEYIDRMVAAMLDKLHVPDFTKSRARRSNDNALSRCPPFRRVAGTPAWRKWLGHDHIPLRFARGVLSPYLNHHHPCLFAIEARRRCTTNPW